MKRFTTALVFFFTFFTITYAQKKLSIHSNGIAKVMDQVLAAKFDPHGPGAVVLIAKDGKVIYKKATGLADLESGVYLKLNHVFRIASLTKQFTAMAILQLAEQGKLRLDDRVTRFIPDYPRGDSITITNLLSHTSGIKNITEIENVGSFISGGPTTPAELINTFKNIPLEFIPGSDFHYSNSGYILLGYIIEKISGLPYEDYIDQNIFKTLKMRNAYFDRPEKIVRNRVRGYVNAGDSIGRWKNAEYINPSGAYSAGALMMTIEDLYKWHLNLFRYKIVKKESLKNALTATILSDGRKISYGFGVGLEPLDGSATIQHSGSINGFSSFEIYLPTENIYVAVFTNAGDRNIMSLSVLAASLVARKSTVQEIFPHDTILNRYAGEYEFPENRRSIFITKKDDKLFFHDPRLSRHAWQIHFRTPTSFICYEVFPNNYVFNVDLNGKLSGFDIKIGDMSLTLNKIR